MKRSILTAAFIGIMTTAQATTLYVDANSPAPAHPYASWSNAAHTIQTAVNSSYSGDTIQVTNGTYFLSSQITVYNSVTIESVNGPKETIIDGQGTARCLYIDNGNAVISGFTIQNGNGAIYNYSPTYGNGGGIFVTSGQNTVITNCIVANNTANNGAGMTYGIAKNCIFINNTASGDSGGMRSGTADNCVFTGNSATRDAGGIGYTTANNCTISGNHSGSRGGGMYGGTANNSIIWGNSAVDPYNQGVNVASASANYSCAPEFTHNSNGCITNNPMLLSASHISSNSPCIGAGTNTYASGTDIDGDSWLSPPSMGCDESTGTASSGDIILSLDSPDVVLAGWEHICSYSVVGQITGFEVDLGNGSVVSNGSFINSSWPTPGTNNIILTAYNADWPAGKAVTNEIIVLDPDSVATYVSVDGSYTNDGLSWATALDTIDDGISAQNYEGGRVYVSNGTYVISQTISVEKDIIIKGSDPATTILEGSGTSGILNLKKSLCIVSGFTITNGASYSGAGIYCENTTPVVSNCVIVGNSGGGMYKGTAMASTFKDNTGDYGGAINEAIAYNCSFAYNEARLGGGAYRSSLRNCLFVGNNASHQGGGMFEGEAFNCTLVGNTAFRGGGIYHGSAMNSIVWDNISGNGTPNLFESHATNSCSPDVEHMADGNITNAPQLLSIYRLAATSPCIGAGNAAYAYGLDLDGEPWLTSPAMGCDEVDGSVPTDGPILLALDLPTNIVTGYEVQNFNLVHGNATEFNVDFGDGTAVTNALLVAQTWDTAGTYDVVLTAMNSDNPSGISVTSTVSVVTPEDAALYVGLTGDDNNDGSSWSAPFSTVQAGIDAQNYFGGIVHVSNGTYSVSSPITINKPIMVQALGGPEETTIDGGGSTNCFTLSQGCVVAGFSIVNGSMILPEYAHFGDPGGGASCLDPWPEVYNSIFHNNGSSIGGGGMSDGSAINCLFVENYVTGYSSGGGMLNGIAINCTFVGNSSGEFGGGMTGGEAYNCIAYTNTSVYGGFNLESVNKAVNCCAPDIIHGEDGNITNAPQFLAWEQYEFRLASTSPCVDAGSNVLASALAPDLAGDARIYNGTVDMGCLEWSPVPSWLVKSTREIPLIVAENNSPPASGFDVWNAAGSAAMDYSFSANVPWITSFTPTTGNSSGEKDAVSVGFDTDMLALGNHTGTISIASSHAPNAPQQISVVVEVIEPVLDHFEFAAIGNQSTGTPFTVGITAKDMYGYTVPSFNDPLPLAGWFNVTNENLQVGSGVDGQYTYSWNRPMVVNYMDYRTQTIYHDDDLGGAGIIESLSLNVLQLPGMAMENFTVRLRHTDLEEYYRYSNNNNWETNWATCYQGTLSVDAEGWVQLDFDTPFEYDGVSNLMVDFSFRNQSTHWNDGYCESQSVSSYRSITCGSYGSDGDPLDWSGLTPASSRYTQVPVIKLGIMRGDSVAIEPTTISNFVDGVWSGPVTVNVDITNMVLQANDGVGHDGFSALFSVFSTASTDSDNDGMDDAWEIMFFGDLTTANATSDFEPDGFLDSDEFMAGTNPTNALSRLAMGAVTAGSGAGEFLVTWQSENGKTYRLLSTTNLLGGTWITNQVNITATAPQNTESVTNSTGAAFFLVELE